MMKHWFVPLLMAGHLMAGCQYSAGREATASGAVRAAEPADMASAEVLAGRGLASEPRVQATHVGAQVPCEKEAYAAFFERFAEDEALRRSHTLRQRASGRSRADDDGGAFRIGIVDNRWVYLAPGVEDPSGYQTLNLRILPPQGDEFQVRFQRAEFDADDQIVSKSGEVGTYRFRHVEGCWRLLAGE